MEKEALEAAIKEKAAIEAELQAALAKKDLEEQAALWEKDAQLAEKEAALLALKDVVEKQAAEIEEAAWRKTEKELGWAKEKEAAIKENEEAIKEKEAECQRAEMDGR